MSRHPNRCARIFLLGCMLASPVTVSAAPITYDFTMNGGPNGPLADVSGNGSFTFDSTIVASADPSNGLATGPGLFQDFQFVWNGISYNLSNAVAAYLMFEVDGNGATEQLGALGFGTTCGADGSCSATGGLNEWFFDGAVSNFNTFVYSLPSFTDRTFTGIGTFRRREANVPEPATMGLMLLGLLGVGAARRRRPA